MGLLMFCQPRVYPAFSSEDIRSPHMSLTPSPCSRHKATIRTANTTNTTTKGADTIKCVNILRGYVVFLYIVRNFFQVNTLRTIGEPRLGGCGLLVVDCRGLSVEFSCWRS